MQKMIIHDLNGIMLTGMIDYWGPFFPVVDFIYRGA